MSRPVYLDHHATTPIDPRVLDSMLPYLRERFGNALSRGHRFGWEAREAVERSREAIAAALGGTADEVVFTAGATESDRLAVLGLARAAGGPGAHVITAPTEHRAVLDPVARLEREGFRVTRLPVDSHGRVDASDLERAITDRTVLITLMAANNEIGTIHPLEEIGRIARRRGVPFHSDAVQAFGRLPLDVRGAGPDAVSLSAHKIHGPKGVGALWLRRNPAVPVVSRMLEDGTGVALPAGTPDVPAIVGFARAAEIASASLDEEARRLASLRDRLLTILREHLDDVELNGDPDRRLPHNLNVSFAGIDGEALVTALDEVAVSTGSACAAEGEPSHVLTALGLDPERVRGSVRFGLGRFNTRDEIERAGVAVAETVRALLRVAPARG